MSFINKNEDYIFQLNITNDLQYQEYINLISTIRSTFNKLRNEYTLQTYHKSYDDLDREQAREVRKQTPLRTIEFYKEDFSISKAKELPPPPPFPPLPSPQVRFDYEDNNFP